MIDTRSVLACRQKKELGQMYQDNTVLTIRARGMAVVQISNFKGT